jgi:CO/xanthine dehydrogenase Mo-binding subunit
MFSKALLQVLSTGNERRQERQYFSLREVADLTEEVITSELEGKAPRPEIHSPDQKEGDVADIPFFPNPRFEAASISIGQCPACGAKSRSGAAFCSRCGHHLLQPTLAPQRSASVSIPPRLEKVRRREDLPLITGKGQYVSDIRRPGMLHVCFLRSPFSHAGIIDMDLNEAQAQQGVVRIVTGAEISELDKFLTHSRSQSQWVSQPCIARGAVNYQGEPVAAVVAESEASAWDAVQTIDVTYEPRVCEIQLDPYSLPGIYEQANIAIIDEKTGGDVEKGFAQADTVVSLRLVQPRLAPAPLEGRAILAEGHSDGTLSVWISHQSPSLACFQLAQILNIPSERIKLTVPQVGGAFGGKMWLSREEAVIAFLAYTLQRPVRWLGESDYEHFVSIDDGLGMLAYLKAAVRRDGAILALKAEIFADLGAYSDDLRLLNMRATAEMISGCYAIPAIKTTIKGVKTNTVPSGSYRDAGGAEACYFIERVVEVIAYELALDPVEVRKRNFILPGAFPYTTATGITYDSGAYASALDLLLTKAKYKALRAEQTHLREQGQYMGIGLCTCMERAGGREQGIGGQLGKTPTPDGKFIVESALVDSGQGHTTTFPFSAHLAVVQVDPETGEVHVQRYMVVDDSGRVLDQVLIEDQIHGGIAQGIGQALYEEVVYDEDGNLSTATLLDYALPKIEDLPTFEVTYTETPRPLNIPDAKEVDTSGCAGALPAVTNAVLDALAPLGVTAIDIPLTREKVWQALHKKP